MNDPRQNQFTVETNELYKRFHSLFEQFYDPLCKYAFCYVKQPEACEDIVQDVFVRIWETRKDLVGSESIRYYLYTAVRNNSLTHLSREQRLPLDSLTADNLQDDDPAWEEHSSISLPEPVNYKAILEAGIAQLPLKRKEVFLLSRMGQLSNQQIADMLNISVKTVNNQLWKAMATLRAYGKKAQSK